MWMENFWNIKKWDIINLSKGQKNIYMWMNVEETMLKGVAQSKKDTLHFFSAMSHQNKPTQIL